MSTISQELYLNLKLKYPARYIYTSKRYLLVYSSSLNVGGGKTTKYVELLEISDTHIRVLDLQKDVIEVVPAVIGWLLIPTC